MRELGGRGRIPGPEYPCLGPAGQTEAADEEQGEGGKGGVRAGRGIRAANGTPGIEGASWENPTWTEDHAVSYLIPVHYSTH